MSLVWYLFDFLLVINSNLPILHRFRDKALEKVQNRYIWLPFFGLPSLRRRGFNRTISVKFLPKGHRWPRYQMA